MNPHDTGQLDKCHLLTSDVRPRMAKASLRKADVADWREQIGRAIGRARILSGLSLKEFADAIGRDERQVARWIGGGERPQFDAIFAVVQLRGCLVIALAQLADADITVDTIITIRRSA